MDDSVDDSLAGTKRDSSSSECISFEMLYVIIRKLGIDWNCLFTLSTRGF